MTRTQDRLGGGPVRSLSKGDWEQAEDGIPSPDAARAAQEGAK